LSLIGTRPVLDRFHDSSKVKALSFMLYAKCLMLNALCFIWFSVLKAWNISDSVQKNENPEKACQRMKKYVKT